MERTLSTLSSGGSLSQQSSSFPSDLAHLPKRALQLQDLSLKEAGFCSSTALAFNTAPRITALLPSPSAGVGRLCARDQTRREFHPQGAHRLCHRQVRLPIFQSKTPPLRGGWTKWRHPNWRETTDPSHPLIHFISPFSPQCPPRPVRRPLPSDSVPIFSPYRHSSTVIIPLPLFLSFLTPRRSAHFGFRRASFSISSASLSGWGLSRIQAPSKTHAQFVAVVSTLVGLPSCAWCATSGATAAAMEFIPLQTTGGWPVELPHMLHPGLTCRAHQTDEVLTWSACIRPSRRGSPSPAVTLHRI